MNMGNDDRKQNKGFTLVEVIVAVVILLIISIPVFRAFASSAKTNGRTILKGYATNVAEDIMEELKRMDVKEAVDFFGKSSNALPSSKRVSTNEDIVYEKTYSLKGGTVYGFSLTSCPYLSKAGHEASECSICKALAVGITNISIKMDPYYYSATNSLNISEFDSVSDEYSAIYSMPKNLPDKIAGEYAKNCENYCKTNYSEAKAKEYAAKYGKEYFLSNLKREIRVFIEESSGDANVSVRVSYLLPKAKNHPADDSSKKLLDDNKLVMVAEDRMIFDNSTSKKELKSVFIFYEPIYDVNANKQGDGDIITVHNRGELEANLYIVPQNSADSSNYEKYADGTTGLNLQIYSENAKEQTAEGKNHCALSLRTNMIEDVDYSKTATASRKKVKAYLNVMSNISDPESADTPFSEDLWITLKNKKGSKNSEAESEKVLAGSLDGKSGKADDYNIDDRIYDVTVTVANFSGDASTVEDAGNWPVSVVLSGTIQK